MNILLALKKKFESGEISKNEYINNMYTYHTLLFDYIDLLDQSNIDMIKINQHQLICRFKDTGIKFICIKGDKRLAPMESINFGAYETKELEMSLNLVSPKDVLFDIGANLGWYAMNVAHKRPDCTIHAFEPILQTYNYLKDNISMNKYDNINVYHLGLSDKEGVLKFYFDDELSVNASLSNVSENKNIKEIECPVKTIDLFVKQQKIDKVDFIKCDVEGAELLVFKGGYELIKKEKPIVFSEMLRKWAQKFNYHPNDIIAYFNDLGYDCFVLRENGLQKFLKVDESTIDTNYFFLHKEKHQEQIQKFLIK